MCTFIHLEENVRRCRWWKHSLENRWKQVFPAAAVGCQGALVASVCRCTVFMWWRLKKKNIFSVWTWIYPWAAESVEMSGKINPTHTRTHTVVQYTVIHLWTEPLPWQNAVFQTVDILIVSHLTTGLTPLFQSPGCWRPRADWTVPLQPTTHF